MNEDEIRVEMCVKKNGRKIGCAAILREGTDIEFLGMASLMMDAIKRKLLSKSMIKEVYPHTAEVLGEKNENTR